MASYVVTAVAVQVRAGARDYFLETDAVLPEGVAQETLDYLLAEGMITLVEECNPEEPAFPEGAPSEEWTGKQLDAFAAVKSVDFTAAKSKADKVAAIIAASTTE